MPVYDYQCDECGHTSELWGVKVADREKTWLCPSCRTGLMHRIVGTVAPAIVFKGPGWTAKGQA